MCISAVTMGSLNASIEGLGTTRISVLFNSSNFVYVAAVVVILIFNNYYFILSA